MKRSAMIPSVPTLAESALPGYHRSSWFGILAPSKTPKDIITRINASIVRIVETAEVKDLLVKQALEPRTTTPEQFGEIIRIELAQNVKLVGLTGAKAD
jgi:tripartite-type tricarboxylate transporter receptor subunit TctC